MKKIVKLFAGAAVLGVLAALSGCGLLGGDKTDVFSLKVGDCGDVASFGGSSVSEVKLVACTEPHNGEVIYLFDMPDGAFDEDAIWDAVKDQCIKAMDSYVGPNWDEVGLEPGGLFPSEGSWNNMHDREIVCYAQTQSGQNELTDTVKGLGR